MQGNLVDQFAKLALQHPEWDVSRVFNIFINAAPMSDEKFISDHFAMFITTAREARNAPKDIQALILRS